MMTFNISSEHYARKNLAMIISFLPRLMVRLKTVGTLKLGSIQSMRHPRSRKLHTMAAWATGVSIQNISGTHLG